MAFPFALFLGWIQSREKERVGILTVSYRLFFLVAFACPFCGDMASTSSAREGGAYFLPFRTLGLARILPGLCNRDSLGAVRPCTQGCCKACSAVYRVMGLTSNKCVNRSLAEELKCFAHRGKRKTNLARTKSSEGTVDESSSNGKHPQSKTKIMTPRAHVSTALV